MRRTLPKKLDEYTTMVAMTHSGTKVLYEYVFDPGKNNEISSSFLSNVKQSVLPKACTSLKHSLEQGVTYEFSYRDPKSTRLGSFVVNRAECSALPS